MEFVSLIFAAELSHHVISIVLQKLFFLIFIKIILDFDIHRIVESVRAIEIHPFAISKCCGNSYKSE